MQQSTDARRLPTSSTRPVGQNGARGPGEVAGLDPSTAPPARVRVHDDSVVITNLSEPDADLAGFVEAAPDPVEATRTCLRLGARAARAVQSTVDTSLIERRFDEMQARFDRQLTVTVESVSDIGRRLLDADGGALTVALDRHRSSLEAMLGATFDPDSKRSVIAVFDAMIATANGAQESALRRLVSLDGDDSPLGRLKRDLAREVREQLGEVKGGLRDISERIAVTEAVAPVIAVSTGKGFTFEDRLDAALCRIAADHGDLAERTGHELGSAATKKGDEVVTLCRDDCPSGVVRIVFEAKTQRLNMRSTIAELNDAMTNRDAVVAVAVFSDQSLAPTSVPFQYFDDKAIVVLDPEAVDDAALRLGYMWARWTARRSTSSDIDTEIDRERIGHLIDSARLAVERATTIRGSHTRAKRAIDQAGLQLDELAESVSQAVSELAGELNGDAQ